MLEIFATTVFFTFFKFRNFIRKKYSIWKTFLHHHLPTLLFQRERERDKYLGKTPDLPTLWFFRKVLKKKSVRMILCKYFRIGILNRLATTLRNTFFFDISEFSNSDPKNTKFLRFSRSFQKLISLEKLDYLDRPPSDLFSGRIWDTHG